MIERHASFYILDEFEKGREENCNICKTMGYKWTLLHMTTESVSCFSLPKYAISSGFTIPTSLHKSKFTPMSSFILSAVVDAWQGYTST